MILSNAPVDYLEYREPFVGGGGVFFNIKCDNKWINDINQGLISVYKSIQSNVTEFLKKCHDINHLEQTFYDMVEHPECYDSDIRYFFINRTVWNGRVNYKIKSRLYFSNPNGWNIIYNNNKIINASKLLQNTKITSIDYSNLFNSSGDQVWIFADPPYMKNTELSEASQLYENNFTKTDHINLNKIIKDCNHKVLLTYDNHPFIKELYKDFNIKEVSWTYSGTSSAKNQSKTKKHGQELIITNY